MRILALLAALVLASTPSQAHVKLFYYPMQVPIRNAPGQTSDGAFSTGGICGGKTTATTDFWFGANGYAQVSDGQLICTRLNFNGGHQTVQYTYIYAAFLCGRPSQNTFQQQVQYLDYIPFVNGTDPAPDESGMQVNAQELNANYQGYTVCVDLPFQNITDGATYNNGENFCTLAVMSYMQGGLLWGGCLDFQIRQSYSTGNSSRDERLYPARTLAPTLPVLTDSTLPVNLTASEGVYKIFMCDPTSGGTCCFEGYFGVSADGAVSASFRGTTSACLWLFNYVTTYQMRLERSPYDADYYTGNLYINIGQDQYGRQYEIQNMSVTIHDSDQTIGGTGGISMTNVGLTQPYVSDHSAVYTLPLDQGVALGLVPYPTGVEPVDDTLWIIIAVVALVLLTYLVGGCIVSKRRGKGCQHPHIHALLLGLGIVKYRPSASKMASAAGGDATKIVDEAPIKKKAGFSIVLPPNWSSAIDQSSGEVYYYNRVSGDVKWDRPSA